MFLHRLITAGCALLIGVPSPAQHPTKQLRATSSVPTASAAESALLSRYAGEPAVTERLDTSYRYHADGTGTKTDSATIRVQTTAGVQALNVLRVPFLPGLQKIEFTGVRVHKPNGQVIETPPADAGEQPAPLTVAVPELSTLRYAVLGVRGLAVGDRLELGIRTTFLQSEDPGQFWGADSFGQGRVILKQTVELRLPAGKAVIVASPHIQPEITDQAGERVYRWTGAQLEPTAAPQKPGSPHAASDLQASTTPSIAWTTFKSWEEVGAWYKAQLLGAATPGANVKRQADQVVYGLQTPEARLQALFQYIRTAIRAVDVPLQNKPVHPHSASDILSSQLGDSVDRAILFAAMCRAEGLSAAPALIAPGQALQQGVPSPEQFTEVITRAQNGSGRAVWLNTASETAPFAALSSELRDRLALVVPAQGASTLEHTPATLPYPAANLFDSTGELSAEGTLTAQVHATLRGDTELRLRDAFHETDEGSWDRVTQLYLHSQNLLGAPSNTSVLHLADTDAPLQVSFDLSRPLYGDWAAHRIVPVEPGLTLPYTDRSKAPESTDLNLGSPRTDSARSRLVLPAGYTVDLPPRLHIVTSFATLDKACHTETAPQHTTLLCERVLKILQSRLPLEMWPDYRAFLDQAAASEPWIQLEHPGSGPAAAGQNQPPPPRHVAEAGEKLAEAREALARKDLSTARVKIQEAQTLNPQEPMLWAVAGVLAQAEAQPAAAEADYQRELLAHPEESAVSLQLASLLQTGKQNSEAIAVLQDAHTLAPGNVSVAQQLAALLEPANPAAAQATLQDALKLTPDSLPLKLALGQLLVQHGNIPQGSAFLNEVVRTSQTVGELNDAAFALADAGVELQAAEFASLHALRLMNSQTVHPVREGPTEDGLRQTLQLTSCWDTLGWVLFRGGNLSEAETWLGAAWNDSFGAVAGQHLAQLLAKQGHREEAAHLAHLAAQGERPEAASLQAHLRDPLAFPTASQQPPSKGSLLAIRSFLIPRISGIPAGTARFEVERADSPEAATARWLTGDLSLAPMAQSLRHADLHTPIPSQTSAHIFRAGLLHCGATGACTFVVFPARAAMAR